MNKSEWKGIWVYLETWTEGIEESSLQLVGEARRLAGVRGEEVWGILIGGGVLRLADEAICRGADAVVVIEDERLREYNPQSYAKTLVRLVRKYKPNVFLFPGTKRGRELASSVAVPLRTGLTADCTAFEMREDGNLVQVRPAFGGKIHAKILTPERRPQLASVRPNVFPTPPCDQGREGRIIEEEPDLGSPRLRRLSYEEVRETELPIERADFVVGGGMGLGSKKGLELLRELASLLGGTVAGTRKVVDAGWLPRSKQVGQTGKTIRPKVYVAVAVSGSAQHMVGVEGAGLIIAINKDPNAPVFELSDYGVVADYREFLPLLVEEIRGMIGSAEEGRRRRG